jgi:acyl-CoA reductase-like NAD-dependent aldehyde dehydrogenase
VILPLIDPRTGRTRGEVAVGRDEEVAAATASARAAAAGWRALTGRERADRLHELAGLIDAHHDGYAAAEQAGTGKPAGEVAGEVSQVADLFRFYAQAARAATTPAAGQAIGGHESWVRREPLGVVAAIVPWNYPLMMAAWRCAPALAAANAVVLKPAESTPDSAALLAGHAEQALGPGVLRCVTGDRETGRLLVRADVDAVGFTGSARAGLDVVARARLKRVNLELGGNCPAVVLPDAPADTFAALAAASSYNAGQSCAAPARVIALRENYDQVVGGLADAMAALAAGADFGPLNNADQAARFDRILGASQARFVKSGAVSTSADEREGFWRPATLLADLPDDDPAVAEEVFGPVLTVQVADDLDHAIGLANGVPQALAASVWSQDLRRSLRAAAEIEAGEVWLNTHLEQTAELPHGGRRGSGHGTDLSVLALQEYQRPKTVTARLVD